MGLENLKSIFDDDLVKQTDDFISNNVINVNETRLFNEPPQPPSIIATNPTDFSTAGIQETPFTPLSQLGLAPLDGLSWENLYNANHTVKDSATFKGLSPVSYPIVNRDKLNIRDNGTRPSIFNLSRNPLGSSQSEPYVVSDIPTSQGLNGGRLQNFGSRNSPLTRAITDSVRIGKYLSSPSGLEFVASQNALGVVGSRSESPLLSLRGEQPPTLVSPQRFNSLYSPLATLATIGGRLTGTTPNVLIRKDSPLPSSFIGYDNVSRFNYKIENTFTGNNGLLGLGNPIIDASTGFPIASGTKFKNPASKSGDKMTLANMVSGESLVSILQTSVISTEDANITPIGVNIEKVQNGLPFYFKDMRDNTYIFFRAYIDSISENISPSYASHNYLGRSEPVYTYERAEREIQMELKLVAQTSDELVSIYKKMDRLTSLCYPEYTNDTYGNRMKTPLTKLRYGEMFGRVNKELNGYIKSIAYSVDNTSPYETEVGKRVPRHVNVGIGYQVIHESAPRLGTKFYGINYNESDDDSVLGILGL